MVSVPDVIRSKRGVIGLGNMKVIGMDQTRVNVRLANARILQQYIDKIGMEGWECTSDVEYEGLPNNGCLIFRRMYIVDGENVETTEESPNFETNLQGGSLYQIFEEETGRYAVYNNKVTKQFKEWKKKRESNNEETIPEKETEAVI